MKKSTKHHSAVEARLITHVKALRGCQLCPRMHRPPVSGGPVVSKVLLVGQAPGDKEPKLGRPFAWTAGKTLFRWFEEHCGMDEQAFRSSIYMAAVCRCFPGKKAGGGDRVPDPDEISNCSTWLRDEVELLRPELVVPVGKLAIAQFLQFERLDAVVGKSFRVEFAGHETDLIPLPHPSGASPWPRIEPGRTLVRHAMKRIAHHRAFAAPAGSPSRMTVTSDGAGKTATRKKAGPWKKATGTTAGAGKEAIRKKAGA